MIKKYDIITIGDCKADHFLKLDRYKVLRQKDGDKLILDYGQKIPVTEFKFFPGGNALNTAVSFTRLGLKAAILTTLGNDNDSKHILERVKAERVATDFITLAQNQSSDKSIVLVTAGERTILSYSSPKSYKLPNICPANWVYLTSLGDNFKTVYTAVKAWKSKADVEISFNPGTRQLLRAIKDVRVMIRLTDILIVNQEEASVIAGAKNKKVKSLLLSLRKLGPKIVVVTCGPKGAWAYDGSECLFLAAYPIARKDGTGAGDAFASAFTAAVMKSQPLGEALRWGSVQAGHEVAKIGVQNGLLSKKSLIQLLSMHPAYRAKSM